MVLLIGSNPATLLRYLKQHGIMAKSTEASQVHSLTGLLLAQPEITDIVMLPEAQKCWSMGHILAAAKLLQGKGYMVFFSSGKTLPVMIKTVFDHTELLRVLEKPKGTQGSKSSGNASGSNALQAAKSESTRKLRTVRPLSIPPGKILFLGVVGSQHRIGCTTQAVGLWHYCKSLGFDAAVVASKEQIAQIAGPMRCEEIETGYRVEGVPFVASTALAYDCYILDFGPGSISSAQKSTDCLVLVAGSKPWELQHTAAALHSAKGAELPVLLSFSSEADANSLRPLFGQQSVAVVPWMPELWHPEGAVLEIYDKLLRPVLERVLFSPDRQNEEIQFTKGDIQ